MQQRRKEDGQDQGEWPDNRGNGTGCTGTGRCVQAAERCGMESRQDRDIDCPLCAGILFHSEKA